MKIDRSKWEDEDWDIEDDIPMKKLTHKAKVISANKQEDFHRKRKQKEQMRERAEKNLQ